MEEQLRRIKNKDLTSLDQRLFGSLDKVETINSTIQNLGQFQKFLLAQINDYEQKAKNKNQDKELAEVIQQNCMNLKQSIMRVVPDLQSSRSRMIETDRSPIKGFRSTGFSKFNKCHNNENQIDKKKDKEVILKVQQRQEFKKSMVKKIDQLKNELAFVKTQNLKLKSHFNDVSISIRKQFERSLKRECTTLLTEKQKLKQNSLKLQHENEKLLKQNQKLLSEISELQKKLYHNKTIEQTPKACPFQTKIKELEIPIPDPVLTKRSNLNESNCSSKRNLIQNYFEKTNKKDESEYKPFMEKMKLDFSSKLNRYYQTDSRPTNQFQNTNFQDTLGTVRQSAASQLQKIRANQEKAQTFRSVQILKNQDSELDPMVPKLLRRNSVLQNQFFQRTENIAKSTKNSPSKQVKPSTQFNYQSIQKNRNDVEPLKQYNSTSKKSNHDLMRKTKSNFFKQPLEQKQNILHLMSKELNQKSLAKPKILQNNGDQNRKRGSQSKQKLKIFSMI